MTPVRRLSEQLWVKDEGDAGGSYGGNKVRKLERILDDAARAGATELLTLGGIGSHHVIATVLHARLRGMRTHALVFAQPDTPHVRANGRAIASLCASVAVLRGPWDVPARWLRLGRPHFVQVGGSSASGAAGWIGGGLELAEQIRAGELPCPARIYVALGTGGTAAGLLAGLAVAGIDSEIVGVQVVTGWVANRARIWELAERALLREGRRVRLGRFRVDGRFFCGGYGAYDERIEAAVAWGRQRGLPIESTYTGKALAAALTDAHGPALFVQTAPRAEPPPGDPLPPELEALLLRGR